MVPPVSIGHHRLLVHEGNEGGDTREEREQRHDDAAPADVEALVGAVCRVADAIGAFGEGAYRSSRSTRFSSTPKEKTSSPSIS